MANEPSGAVVSVSFNDGKNDQIITARPIMSKYGIPARCYICDAIGSLANR